ncbi:MAG: vWA domain-containing protein [Polyangiaceae bacterium]
MGSLTGVKNVSALRSTNVRRAVAGAAIVLATGGLILARASTAAPPQPRPLPVLGPMGGTNTASFAGPGAHGQVALSHTKVLAGSGESVFAEVRLAADPAEGAKERAPLALVVVLDTSGSMEGEKIDRAKDSVLGLMRDMRDDDEIAFVRYSSDAELIQPLAHLGEIRSALTARVRRLEAGGGTNIPSGLSMGLRTLNEAEQGRVRRVVLVSDGLDSTRAQAERLASDSAERGITVSSMGIGLDFDESYMSSLARDGHGNFGFVNDGAALATFLTRELDEASTTTVESATVRLALPKGVRFLRATGADVRQDGDAIVVKMGSLFAGDERRAVLELSTKLDADDVRQIGTEALWHRVGGSDADVHAPNLSLVATVDKGEVQRGKDGAVLASATSVISSQRELEAAQAYSQGDQARANSLIQQNISALASAAAAAPAKMAASLHRQASAYDSQMKSFAAPPSSDEVRRAAKTTAAKESSNLDRSAY